MAERRYNDKEIAAIFRTAAEAQTNPPREVPADEGLTLSDLQAIGREVGIPADAVAHAAQAIDVRVGAASRTILGLPLGVARTANLNRRAGGPETCARRHQRAHRSEEHTSELQSHSDLVCRLL